MAMTTKRSVPLSAVGLVAVFVFVAVGFAMPGIRTYCASRVLEVKEDASPKIDRKAETAAVFSRHLEERSHSPSASGAISVSELAITSQGETLIPRSPAQQEAYRQMVAYARDKDPEHADAVIALLDNACLQQEALDLARQDTVEELAKAYYAGKERSEVEDLIAADIQAYDEGLRDATQELLDELVKIYGDRKTMMSVLGGKELFKVHWNGSCPRGWLAKQGHRK